MKLSNEDFLSIFDGVPQATVSKSEINDGISIVDLLAGKTGFLASNGEAKRELKANAISVNKDKISETEIIDSKYLINDRFILLGKGKKNNFIVVAE